MHTHSLAEPHRAADAGVAARPAQDGFDLEACRRLMRGGSKTFFAASLLLPARVCAPASALYAYCRLADDAIDLGNDAAAAMRDLHARLDALYARRPAAQDADRALAEVVHRYAIPRALLDALLEGFWWDARGRRYDTLDDLAGYGARVAGTVGAMMSLIMGVRSRQALARACELGVAMQFTNIARDVGEDARAGRLYLPRQWLQEAGIAPEAWLRAPQFTPALAGVVQRLLNAAEGLYRRAEQGIALLPRDCRAAIHAARLVYAEIGHQLERDGLDSVHHRATVSPTRKLALVARATRAAWAAPHDATLAHTVALPAVQFLVDAAARDDHAPAVTPTVPRRSLHERMDWIGALYVRLIEQEHVQQQVRWAAHQSEQLAHPHRAADAARH
jgi:15-cis-phytoene synthase